MPDLPEPEMPLTIDLGQVNLDTTWQDIADKPFTSLGQGLVVNDGILTIDESKLGGGGGYKNQFAYISNKDSDGYVSIGQPYDIRFDSETPSEIVSVSANNLIVSAAANTICSGFEFGSTPITLSSRGNVITSVTNSVPLDSVPPNALFRIGVLSVNVGIMNMNGSWKMVVNNAKLYRSPTDGEQVLEAFNRFTVESLIVRYK